MARDRTDRRCGTATALPAAPRVRQGGRGGPGDGRVHGGRSAGGRGAAPAPRRGGFRRRRLPPGAEGADPGAGDRPGAGPGPLPDGVDPLGERYREGGGASGPVRRTGAGRSRRRLSPAADRGPAVARGSRRRRASGAAPVRTVRADPIGPASGIVEREQVQVLGVVVHPVQRPIPDHRPVVVAPVEPEPVEFREELGAKCLAVRHGGAIAKFERIALEVKHHILPGEVTEHVRPVREVDVLGRRRDPGQHRRRVGKLQIPQERVGPAAPGLFGVVVQDRQQRHPVHFVGQGRVQPLQHRRGDVDVQRDLAPRLAAADAGLADDQRYPDRLLEEGPLVGTEVLALADAVVRGQDHQRAVIQA